MTKGYNKKILPCFISYLHFMISFRCDSISMLIPEDMFYMKYLKTCSISKSNHKLNANTYGMKYITFRRYQCKCPKCKIYSFNDTCRSISVSSSKERLTNEEKFFIEQLPAIAKHSDVLFSPARSRFVPADYSM